MTNEQSNTSQSDKANHIIDSIAILSDSTCERVAVIGFSNSGIESELYDQYHNGGLAEFVRAPHYLVDKLPDCISFEVAAKVHDLATAPRALKLADLRKTSITLTAPTSAMGALTLRLEAIYSVRHIILVGRSKERLEHARSLTPAKTSVLALEPSDGLDPETANLVGELSRIHAPEVSTSHRTPVFPLPSEQLSHAGIGKIPARADVDGNRASLLPMESL
ncbi:chaperonin 10-like protein [Diaporthe eres]|nr:chaperonin 10-like protein [Diaporthe eres]